MSDLVLEQGDLQLKPATEEELELLMAWRSHPEIYKYFFKQDGPLKWAEHYSFWESRKDRIDWIIYLTENSWSRKVGSVNVTGLSDDCPEIGVYIGEITLMSKGIGKRSVGMVVQYLQSKAYQKVCAHISQENIKSQRLFTSLGFMKTSELHDGAVWVYAKKL